MKNNDHQKKVVYIMGAARSGSTLVDMSLSQIRGVSTVGEAWFLWRRGLIENRYCACGERFADCKFWSQFNLQQYMSELKLSTEEIDSFLDWRAKWGFLQNFILIDRKRKNVIKILDRLYNYAVQRSGDSVIVDSSKWPAYALLLGKIKSIELYTINVVRDPRAVAFSWTKNKKYAPFDDSVYYFKKLNFIQSVIEWSISVVTAEIVGLLLKNKMTIRYEDFSTHPKKTLNQILDHIEREESNLSLNDDVVEFRENHSISGNPIRFKRGKVKIKLDEEWRTKQSFWKNLIITILTFPFLTFYGYPINSKK